MPQHFQISGLSRRHFSALMSMSNDQLKQHAAHWITVDESPGYPCRVSLRDAAIGERVLACSYQHHKVNSAYQASGPVFVRELAQEVSLAVGQIPAVLSNRKLSLRAYDSMHLMAAACLAEGCDVAEAIESLLAHAAVNYIHIHNAGPGCFSCAVNRVL